MLACFVRQQDYIDKAGRTVIAKREFSPMKYEVISRTTRTFALDDVNRNVVNTVNN